MEDDMTGNMETATSDEIDVGTPSRRCKLSSGKVRTIGSRDVQLPSVVNSSDP